MRKIPGGGWPVCMRQEALCLPQCGFHALKISYVRWNLFYCRGTRGKTKRQNPEPTPPVQTKVALPSPLPCSPKCMCCLSTMHLGEQGKGEGREGCTWRCMQRQFSKKLATLLDLCVSSLRRGHANLLCIVPILTDCPLEESSGTLVP